jgi:hypothetical protein
MSLFAELRERLDLALCEVTLRILVPDWDEFDALCETTNEICDRYDLANLTRDREPESFKPSPALVRERSAP